MSIILHETLVDLFFGSQINIPSLRLLSEWYNETLEHLQLVDALDNRAWNVFSQTRDDEMNSPDPLVMLAWRCKRLSHLSLIGESQACFIIAQISTNSNDFYAECFGYSRKFVLFFRYVIRRPFWTFYIIEKKMKLSKKALKLKLY